MKKQIFYAIVLVLAVFFGLKNSESFNKPTRVLRHCLDAGYPDYLCIGDDCWCKNDKTAIKIEAAK